MSIERMKELQKSMAVKHQFKPGDVVVWKDGLKNRVFPKYGERVVVFDVLETPVFECNVDSGSPYFNEPLDFSCGKFDDHGDCDLYFYDSRRFELAQ